MQSSILVAKVYKFFFFGREGRGDGPSLHASHVRDARLFWGLFGMVGNQVLKNFSARSDLCFVYTLQNKDSIIQLSIQCNSINVLFLQLPSVVMP